MKDLKNTVMLMNSDDYKERFRGEYYQLKIRLERLNSLLNKIEASDRTQYGNPPKRIVPPKHECPYDLLMDQKCGMERYLHALELRAIIEEITL